MGSLGFSRYRPLGEMNRAPVLGLRQGPNCFTGFAYWSSFNPASRTWGVGLRAYFLNPITNIWFFYSEKKSYFYSNKKNSIIVQQRKRLAKLTTKDDNERV